MLILVVKYTLLWPSRLGQQNTPTASPQRGNTPPTSLLNMILNMICNAEVFGDAE